MGIGDDIIATSMARGAASRGELIAFGDGKRVIWGPHSEMIFRGNPNIARPGQERDQRVRWCNYYKGCRIYNSPGSGKWVWNYGFKVEPGEIFLEDGEVYPHDDRRVIVEPNLPGKTNSKNKEWPASRWLDLVGCLTARGWRVRQFGYGGCIKVAPEIRTSTFREAAGALKTSRLAILTEGGLHHAAAAVGLPAVVLFGGFAPPDILGYDTHTNLTGGAEACGSFCRCQHCVDAMSRITVSEVLTEAEKLLHG